jgi:hypothetical protein
LAGKPAQRRIRWNKPTEMVDNFIIIGHMVRKLRKVPAVLELPGASWETQSIAFEN